MTQKNNIEHAFDTLKCYIESYASRASQKQQKEIASKLEDALNVLIEFYNSSETKYEDIIDVKNSRDLYLYLLLNESGRDWRELYFDRLKDIPASYIVGYINSGDSQGLTISKKIINAAKAWDLRKSALLDIDNECEMLNAAIRRGASDEIIQIWNNQIKENYKFVRELTY